MSADDSASAVPSGSVCLLNLGPRETRKRLLAGLVWLGLALVASGLALLLRWAWAPRLGIVVGSYLGFVSLLQARAKT